LPEAEATFAKADVKPGWALPWEATLAVRQGKIARAEALLKQVTAGAGDAGNYQQAEILAQLGRKDEAIATLQQALAARDPGLTEILVDAMLDPLRSEPRFQALVKKLDFPT
jgi:tetratricopeptide (TPR) repeat protein